jgi:DNA replication and repair protein RecF
MNNLVLQNLQLIHFKNFSEANINLSEKINCFVGNNGSGKTNILDAIHYLSVTKSYFNSVDTQNIQHEAPFFVVEGAYTKGEHEEKIYCGLKKGQKKVLKRNGKEYDRISEHIGLLPLVIISPSDNDLILEGSEIRRKFMDNVISQSDPLYLDDLIAYNKALTHRNALLKYFAANRKFDPDTLDIYNELMKERGERIYEKRIEFIENLKPLLLSYYKKIAGSHESVSIDYTSHLHDRDFDQLWKDNLDKDRVLQYTSQGVHRDDLKFSLFGYPLKKTGSQGQQKSFLIALKLAQFEFLKKLNKSVPLLLLDDIFDKLDEIRVENLIKLVNEHHFGQIFITDTHPERTMAINRRINEESRIFDVTKGMVNEKD